MEETETLLSDLCSVCHIAVPKYKCPRCSTRTCSLTCSKRHKARAECSGVRDPTKFIPKSKLETEQAFDHDFNFLSSLERNLSKDVSNSRQNVHPVEPGSRRRTGGGARKEQYWDAVRRANVRVLRAPVGMARSKENNSRLGYRSKMLIWTVEWLFEDGQRCLVDGPADTSVGHSYDIAIRALERTKKPKIKRNEDLVEKFESARRTEKVLDQKLLPPEDQEPEPEQPLENHQIVLPENEEMEPTVDIDDVEQVNLPATEQLTEQVQPTADNEAAKQLEPLNQATNRHARKRKLSTPSLPENVYVYLLKARTSGSQKVLIPVRSQESLGNVLRNREVMEFPSFQVLSTPPGDISTPFIIEADYLNKSLQEEEEIRELASAADDLVARQDRSSTKTEKAKRLENDNDILAILQRDILGV